MQMISRSNSGQKGSRHQGQDHHRPRSHREQGEKELEELLRKNMPCKGQIAIQEVETTLFLYAEGSDERAALEVATL